MESLIRLQYAGLSEVLAANQTPTAQKNQRNGVTYMSKMDAHFKAKQNGINLYARLDLENFIGYAQCPRLAANVEFIEKVLTAVFDIEVTEIYLTYSSTINYTGNPNPEPNSHLKSVRIKNVNSMFDGFVTLLTFENTNSRHTSSELDAASKKSGDSLQQFIDFARSTTEYASNHDVQRIIEDIFNQNAREFSAVWPVESNSKTAAHYRKVTIRNVKRWFVGYKRQIVVQ